MWGEQRTPNLGGFTRHLVGEILISELKNPDVVGIARHKDDLAVGSEHPSAVFEVPPGMSRFLTHVLKMGLPYESPHWDHSAAESC